jgi:hypothetical protein
MEKELASIRGVSEAAKELLDEEREKHKKEHDQLRKDYHSQRLKIEDEFDKNRREYQSRLEQSSTEMETLKKTVMELQLTNQQLEREKLQLADSKSRGKSVGKMGKSGGAGGAGGEISNAAPQMRGNQLQGKGVGTSIDQIGMLKIILAEIRDKKKENESLALKIEFEKNKRDLLDEYEDKIADAKKEAKLAFKLTLENIKLSYEHEIKSLKQENRANQQQLVV